MTHPTTILRPTIALFDMDGTTVRHLNPRMLNILEKVDDLFYRISDSRAPGKHRPPPLHRPKILVHRALHSMRSTPVEQMVKPCLGIIDVLRRLRAMNVTCALVSNGLGKGYGHDVLEKFDLSQYFQATIFREDFLRAKPDPDPLLRAINALGVSPSTRDVVWCIGDRRKDITAALALGRILPCPVQPFSYGLQAAIAILENHLPSEHILASYRDLELILDRMKGHLS